MSTQIIVDACNNHLGSVDIIEEMIYIASQCGADYIKFQSFTSYKLKSDYPNYDFMRHYYQKCELSDVMYTKIIDLCELHLIKPLFTIFDKDKIDFLCDIGVKECKIASPDAQNYNLIDKCIEKFDKVFISTGMMYDIDISKLIKKYRSDKVKFFYCVSKYPTNIAEIDYNKMLYFDGFSDHTEGIDAAKNAIHSGIEYVEKHFTLNKMMSGKDQSMSIEPKELKELCEYRDYIEKCKQYKERWI